MSEKLSDAEVDEVLIAMAMELQDQRTYVSSQECQRDWEQEDRKAEKLEQYERRIAALDAVLAERRERKNKGENNGT